jgi:hypothetical protein
MQIDSKFRSLLLILLMTVIGISYLTNRSTTRNEVLEPSPRAVGTSKEMLPQARTVPPVEEQSRVTLTIDGYDRASKSVIPRINLWNDYETRARVVGQVSDSEKVLLIKRVGDGVLVETHTGVRGWLTYWFIKEYNK